MAKAKSQYRAARRRHRRRVPSASLLPQDLQCISYLCRHGHNFTQTCTTQTDVRRMAPETADILSVSNAGWGMFSLGGKELRRQAITFLQSTNRKFCIDVNTHSAGRGTTQTIQWLPMLQIVAWRNQVFEFLCRPLSACSHEEFRMTDDQVDLRKLVTSTDRSSHSIPRRTKNLDRYIPAQNDIPESKVITTS